MPERLVRHHRSEIGSADANVDDGPNGLTRVAAPLAVPDEFGEGAHSLEDLVNLRHHVDTVNDQRGVLWHAKRDVQHGAIFRDVDGFSGEHGVSTLLDPRLLG